MWIGFLVVGIVFLLGAVAAALAVNPMKGLPFFGFFYGFVVFSDELLTQLVDPLYAAFTG